MAKSLYTKVGEIKGKKKEDQTSFTHQYSPTAEELKASRGNFYLLLHLHNSSGSNAVKIDQDIFQTFQSSYYSSSVGGVLIALEKAFEQTNISVLEKEKSLSTQIKFDLIAVVLWGEALYLVKTQNTGVIFQRGNVAKELKFNKTASGSIRDKDSIFLVSKKFIEQIGVDNIVESLRQESFQKAVESLNKTVLEQEGSDALLLRVYLEEPKQQVVEMVDVGKKSSSNIMSKFNTVFARTKSYLITIWLKFAVLSAPAKAKVLVYLTKLGNKLLEPWRPREPGNIGDPTKRRRARAAQIVVALVLLFTLSIGLALMSRANSANQADFSEKLSVIESTLDEAENLAKINPDRSTELLGKVDQDLEEAKTYEIKSDRLQGLLSRFGSLQETVRNIYGVSLDEFHKFSISVDELISVNNIFVVLDREKSKIISLDKNSKNEKDISFDSGIGQIAIFENSLFVQSGGGINKINLSSFSSSKAQSSHSGWGNLVGAGTYQGNFYLLDSSKKEVWKYLPSGEGLSSPQSYFKNKVDTGEPSAIAVDGAIWIGNKEGEIFKFLGGNQAKFEISGLDKPFGEIASIFTTIPSSRLFILDKSNGRVVIIDKNGSYISQHTAGEFKEATSLWVDESKKTVYLGVGETIKSFKY